MRFLTRIIGMVATGNVRGLATLLLGLTLIGGLWETSLYNLSARATATSVMTEVGVELVNPVLVNNSLGLSNTLYIALQAQAKANPTQALSIPGLKVRVTGREIAGKSFSDGSRVIYAKVADGYYDGGWAAVLAVPDSLTRGLGALAVLPQAVASQGAKQVGAPQLPNVPLPPLGAVGLSLQTFTAQGHAQVLTLVKWFLGIAAACLLLLALASTGWRRLTTPAWALISGALPGAFGIGVIAFFWARNAPTFKPYSGLLHLLAGAFVPVYIGAIGIGVAALIAAAVGDVATRTYGIGQAVKARARAQAQQQAARQAPAPLYRPPASAGSAQGYGDWGYQERRPIGSAGGNAGGMGARAPQVPPGRPANAPPPRSSPAGANAPAWQPPGQGSGWQPREQTRPAQSGRDWGQQQPAAAPQQPAGPRPGWMAPDEPRAPYAGPDWASEPAGAGWSPAPQREQWSPDPPADPWPDTPPWGAPPAPPARAPYGRPDPRDDRWSDAGQPPYGSRYPGNPGNPGGQGSTPGGSWGSSEDDDPWSPRGR
ncbi:MAG TPA: hypothetical protein VGR57_20200 [Ktedonobacterales bacterium]|nr:hypothetical protein [Ktedonobacterales bacterium]